MQAINARKASPAGRLVARMISGSALTFVITRIPLSSNLFQTPADSLCGPATPEIPRPLVGLPACAANEVEYRSIRGAISVLPNEIDAKLNDIASRRGPVFLYCG